MVWSDVRTGQAVSMMSTLPQTWQDQNGNWIMGNIAGYDQAQLLAIGIAQCNLVNADYNPADFTATGPVLTFDGTTATATWTLTAIPAPVAPTPPPATLQSLWVAASQYQLNTVNANGLAVAYAGLAKGLPNSTAMIAWVNSIWTLYYSRKTAGAPYSTDFTSIGACSVTFQSVFNEVSGG